MTTTRLRSNDPCWCGSKKKFKRCHGDHTAAKRQPLVPGEVSALRTVPDEIVRPPYVETGTVTRAPLQIQDAESLVRMRRAGAVAAEVLLEAGAAVAPGVTTEELDRIAHEAYLARGAYPSTLQYRGYRKSVCTSVNEVVCHGIPDSRPLVEGDIVNIDVTAYLDGHHGDTSATFYVGKVDEATRSLVETTRRATLAGIKAVKPGLPIRVIGEAIQPYAFRRGLGVIEGYGGHGIGATFHADPHIPHTMEPSASTIMVPGMTFTIEPMLTAGTATYRTWDDGWTVVTDDLLPSAQFEHTVVVTEDGVEILTVTEDGRSAVDPPA